MSGINRFLTKREKHGEKRDRTRQKEGSDSLYAIFSPLDKKKKTEKEEEKKVKSLHHKLSRAGISNLKEPQIEYALQSNYSNGDPDKAFELLVLFEDSLEGIVKEYDPHVHFLGAENRMGVTCYLDALLFAMFARLNSFEAMLYNSYEDEPRKRLSTLLRLWVNLLRSGKLITTDLTKHLQESLAACGWPEAAELQQQDVSEAFTFITEKLELPLLTLKMDIYHTGKEEEADDHKFVNERLLEVAIPSDLGDGKIVTLEDCLETYFNNRIEVRRHLERRATMDSMASPKSDIMSEKAALFHLENVETSSRPLTPESPFGYSPVPISPISTRARAPSIIRDRYLPDEAESSDPPKYQPRARRKSSARKEVLMPAWQFFSLIPWYTDNAPTNDAQVAAHFSSKRPVLGLCLKRYSMRPNGTASRLSTYVDIPLEIGLPHFIQDDSMGANGPLFGNFKLSLQSVVCHRGHSVNSGHYISLIRGQAPSISTASIDPEADSSSEEWMRFDDLAPTRIVPIDIKETLKQELPYLLFYQVQPVSDSSYDDPPPYTSDSGTAGPSASSTPIVISRANSIDPDRRPSLSIPTDALPAATVARRGSIAGSLVAPDDNTANASSSTGVSRRNSRIGTSKSRTSSSTGEARLSATFSRVILGRDERDKENEKDQEVVAVKIDQRVEKKKIKKEKEKEKRAKSRTRTKLEKGEERECVLM